MPKQIKATKGLGPKSLLRIQGSGTIRAINNKEGLPKIKILAYTGEKIQIGGWDAPVVMAVKGLKFEKDVTPIINEHDGTQRIGHTTLQEIDEARSHVKAEGLASASTKQSAEFVKSSRRGFPYQNSVGVHKLRDITYYDRGESFTANGKTFKGPAYHVDRGSIYELSVVTFGADSNTSSVALNHPKKGTKMNPFEKWLKLRGINAKKLEPSARKVLHASFKAEIEAKKSKPAKGTTVVATKKKVKATADDSDEKPVRNRIKAHLDSVNAAAAENQDRIDRINAIAIDYADREVVITAGKKELSLQEYKTKAIKEGIKAEAFELEVLRAARPEPNGTFGIHMEDYDVKDEVVEAALLKQYMSGSGTNKDTGKKYGVEEYFDEKVLEASDKKQFRGISSLHALMDAQIRAAGRMYTGLSRKSGEFASAAIQAMQSVRASGFSTFSITNVLENATNKIMLDSFNKAEGVWSQLCHVTSANDFRPVNMYSLDLNGSFKKVHGGDGVLSHVSMNDRKRTLSLDTYGAMIAVDRKTMINDDLGRVLDVARSIGTLGAIRLEEGYFVFLLANSGSFFSVGNNNAISGGASVLSLTSLETARQVFYNQTINGKPITNYPTILLHPPALKQTADNIYTKSQMAIAPATTKTFDNNEFVGQFRPVMSPWLSNTAILDQDGRAISGQSSTGWYLFCDPGMPQGAAVHALFLQGRRTPIVDTNETEFSIPAGIQMRAYFEFGFGFNQEKCGLKSAGA